MKSSWLLKGALLIPIIFIFLIGIDFWSKQITEEEEKILAKVEKLLEHPGFSVIEMGFFAGKDKCIVKYCFSEFIGLTHVILESKCSNRKFQKITDQVIKIFREASIFAAREINVKVEKGKSRINILEDITIEQLLKTLYRLATHFEIEKVPDLK